MQLFETELDRGRELLRFPNADLLTRQGNGALALWRSVVAKNKHCVTDTEVADGDPMAFCSEGPA